MLSLGAGTRILMAVEPVDLRRGHDGLVRMVQELFRADPYDGSLYVFFGRRMDRVKILVFNAGGFIVYYKRMERNRFTLPLVDAATDRIVVDATTLAMLLDGVDVRAIKRSKLWEPRRKSA